MKDPIDTRVDTILRLSCLACGMEALAPLPDGRRRCTDCGAETGPYVDEETPLETARRLWPGAWVEQPDGDLQRVLFCAPIGLEYIQIRKPWSTGMKDWIAYYHGSTRPTIGVGISQGPLEDTIERARDKVQSMARDFARAAGLP